MAGHGIRCRPGPARPARGTRLWSEAPQLRIAAAAARVHKEQRLCPWVPRARAREGPLCRGVGPAERAAQTAGPLSLTALQPPARPRAPCDDAPDNGIELCREATRKQNEIKRNGLLFPSVGTCLGTLGARRAPDVLDCAPSGRPSRNRGPRGDASPRRPRSSRCAPRSAVPRTRAAGTSPRLRCPALRGSGVRRPAGDETWKRPPERASARASDSAPNAREGGFIFSATFVMLRARNALNCSSDLFNNSRKCHEKMQTSSFSPRRPGRSHLSWSAAGA